MYLLDIAEALGKWFAQQVKITTLIIVGQPGKTWQP